MNEEVEPRRHPILDFRQFRPHSPCTIDASRAVAPSRHVTVAPNCHAQLQFLNYAPSASSAASQEIPKIASYANKIGTAFAIYTVQIHAALHPTSISPLPHPHQIPNPKPQPPKHQISPPTPPHQHINHRLQRPRHRQRNPKTHRDAQPRHANLPLGRFILVHLIDILVGYLDAWILALEAGEAEEAVDGGLAEGVGCGLADGDDDVVEPGEFGGVDGVEEGGEGYARARACAVAGAR